MVLFAVRCDGCKNKNYIIMSLTTVLKNVCTFTQIINQASTESVKQWDAKSLNNAFNWAAYCEQVYQHVRDKPFRDNLEKHLNEMTSLLSPASCLTLTVESLGKATELLEEKLLLNEHLNLDMVERLLIQNTNVTVDGARLTDKLHRLASLTNTAKLCHNILKELMTETGFIQKSDDIPSQSHILYNHFLQQLTLIPQTYRFNSYVKSVLSRLSELNGMVIIVCLISVYEENKTWPPGEDMKVYQIIVSWFEGLAQEKPRKLLDVDKGILCNVSAGSTMFLDLYIQCLVNWGKSMNPFYDKKYFPKLYQWRPPKEFQAGSYVNLVGHFKYLYSSQQYFKQIITDRLKTLIGSQFFSIWTDMNREIERISDKQ